MDEAEVSCKAVLTGLMSNERLLCYYYFVIAEANPA
jgi:hypothetical protein